jgi:serine/threonine protein kinase
MLILVTFITSSKTKIQSDTLNKSCSFYIKNLPKYQCVKDTSIGRVNGTLIFQIKNKKKKQFALKVKPRSTNSVKEIAILKELKDMPYVIQLYDEFSNDEFHMLILEFAARNSLEMVLQTSDYFSDMEKTLEFFKMLMEGIQSIHKKGYVHAKICIENIVLTENYEPRIIDLNAAEKIGAKDYFKGIPIYMSPELVKALNKKEKIVYDGAIDVFAAGIVFYYIKYHYFPLSNYHMEYMQMINTPIEFEEGSSSLFMYIVNKCLQLKNTRYNDEDLIAYLKMNVDHFDDTPLVSNYFYTMEENDLRIYRNTVSEVNYWTICILIAAVLVFSASMLFCYFQVCLFMIWSKTDANRMSLPTSERNVQTKFMDSTATFHIKQPVQSMDVSNH